MWASNESFSSIVNPKNVVLETHGSLLPVRNIEKFLASSLVSFLLEKQMAFDLSGDGDILHLSDQISIRARRRWMSVIASKGVGAIAHSKLSSAYTVPPSLKSGAFSIGTSASKIPKIGGEEIAP